MYSCKHKKKELYTEILSKMPLSFIRDVSPGGHNFIQNNDPKHVLVTARCGRNSKESTSGKLDMNPTVHSAKGNTLSAVQHAPTGATRPPGMGSGKQANCWSVGASRVSDFLAS